VIRQYDIYIVGLDPTVGAEMKKTRPCLVLSPDEMNKHMLTVQVAPLTTTTRAYPWRVPIQFEKKSGMVALDQLRTVDRRRLPKRAGRASKSAIEKVKTTLHEMLIA
jgi:mRNA interferase MazF